MKSDSTRPLLILMMYVTIISGLVGIAYSFGFISNVAIGGFSTLSLSQASFNSNDPSISGQAWLLTISENGAGQSASGTFTATDPSKNAESNQFTITTKIDENKAVYNILNQNQFIQKVEYTTFTANPLQLLYPNKGCNMDVWQYVYKPSISAQVSCWKFTNQAVLGSVSSANINFKTTISVQGSGGTDSCTISNVGSTSCTSANGNVQSSWAGSLVSGQAPPQPTDQNIIALYKTSSGGWITADGNVYSNWKSSKDNLINCLSSGQGESCFTKLNNLESTLLAGKVFQSSGGDVATTSGTQSNGKISLDLPTQVQFPVITMRIKASLIGINIPVGKPSITSTSSTKFQTGSSGIIQVTVKNVGTGTGSFDVSATCSNGFSQTGNTLRISSLAQGESQTVYLPISSNVVSGDLNGDCTVLVTDVNNPSNKDTDSVSVSSSAIGICEKDELRISGNTIEVCQDNTWKLLSSCGELKVAEYNKTGQPECIDKALAGKGNFITNFFGSIKNFFTDLFNGTITFLKIVKYGVVIIGAIASTVVLHDVSAKLSPTLRRRKTLRGTLSVLFGIIIGAILYTFIYSFIFWALFVSFVVWFILIKLINPLR